MAELKGTHGIANMYLGEEHTGDITFDIQTKEIPEQKYVVFRNIVLDLVGKTMALNKHVSVGVNVAYQICGKSWKGIEKY